MGFSPKQVRQWLEDLAKASGKPVATLPVEEKESKYRSKRVTVNGIKFDSKKESVRWGMLLLKQRHGVISDLKRQVSFELEVQGQPVCKYIADATYLENGALVVEDTKSDHTRKLSTYRLKKRLMKAVYNIEIKEV